MSDPNLFWGIDLGGTKIEGIVLAGNDLNTVIVRHRIPTEAEAGYQQILKKIKDLIDYLASKSDRRPNKLGIGTPGTTDPSSGLLKNSNTLCLNGKPFRSDLQKLLGVPVSIANDANCFALAEYHLGVIKQFPDAKNMFGVIMGTGVGGGLIANGQLITGHHGIGGEWGHMTLIDDGDPCYCGRRGCVEMVIAGPALERFYFQKSGVHKKLRDILDDLKDDNALATRSRLLHYFGKALGQVVNVFDPDVIVIGGGIGQQDFLYEEGRIAVAKNIFNPVFTTPMVKPVLGDSAGVFGAALLIA